MTSKEIRKKFLEFYEKRGHVIIPSASLVPENDPTTLFTGSGMQPLVPYLLGAPHPEGKRVANAQKCFRAEDIDEVGRQPAYDFFRDARELVVRRLLKTRTVAVAVRIFNERGRIETGKSLRNGFFGR